MELKDLIATRKATHSAKDTGVRLLVVIQRLEANRALNLYALAEKCGQLQRLLDQQSADASEELLRWMRAYRQSLDADLAERRQQFGAALADGLAPLGLRLKGQYPKLHAGLFVFDLNLDKGRCRIWYGPEQERLVETSLDAAKVVDQVQRLQNSLGSGCDLQEWLDLVRRADPPPRLDQPQGVIALPTLLPYLAIFLQEESFRTDPTKEKYRNYGRADFSYDLYSYGDASIPFRLAIANRQQTRHRSDFLWVPTRLDVETGNYYATLVLKEETT